MVQQGNHAMFHAAMTREQDSLPTKPTNECYYDSGEA